MEYAGNSEVNLDVSRGKDMARERRTAVWAAGGLALRRAGAACMQLRAVCYRE